MSTTIHSGMPVSTRHTLWQGLALSVGEIWRAWREARAQRNRVLALRGLSCATLRDVGLADQVACRASLTALDYQRGLW